jgi:hypothetical protein
VAVLFAYLHAYVSEAHDPPLSETERSVPDPLAPGAYHGEGCTDVPPGYLADAAICRAPRSTYRRRATGRGRLSACTGLQLELETR